MGKDESQELLGEKRVYLAPLVRSDAVPETLFLFHMTHSEAFGAFRQPPGGEDQD